MANIGIVGTGWGARVQVPTFREAGLNVVAIAGFHRNKTMELANELGLRGYERWQDLVESPEINLVSIVTPPSEHREMAITALEHRRHVLLEKPTAMSVLEAEHLAAAAAARPDRIALIDHELRFLPSWREARTRIGQIGPIRYAEVRYASPSRGDRKRAWNWWSDANRGGGIWGAVGSHFVDALRYFGLEAESVQAMLRTVIAERPFGEGTREVTSDDFASVDLRFHGGAVAMLNFSVVSAGPDEASTMTIYGERGAMRFVGEEVLESIEGRPFRRMAGGDLENRPGNSPGGAFGSGTLHLGRALRAALDDGDLSALKPGATFADGLAQQRILDAAREASRRGQWVEI